MTILPSPGLAATIAAGHLLAAAAMVVAPLPAPAGAACVLVCLASMGHHVRRAAVRSRGAIVKVSVDGGGQVTAVHRDGAGHAGTLLASTFVSESLTILRWRGGARQWPRSVLLVRGNCDPHAYRRLRVALAWRIGPALSRTGRAD